MTPETFLEKFDQFADAPKAADKLRELVLDWAVQGRLSAPLANDGVVPSKSEFHRKTAALADSLRLRSPKPLVGETEPPFEIPPYWRWMALAELGAAQTGTTPSKKDRQAFNGDIPFIKPADILPNSMNYSNESLSRHDAERGSRLAPSGSLFMVCIGTIGKCNLIERECAFNQQINSLTSVSFVDPRYLLAVARSRYFQDVAWQRSSSTTIAILNKGKWLSILVPIPPLLEQKRIVAKVDELMALCDRLESQQQERDSQQVALARASVARFADAPISANLNFLFHKSYTIPPADIRKSIFTVALQGKLVPRHPGDGAGTDILKDAGIAETSMKGVPKLPDHWVWARLGALVTLMNSGWSPACSPKPAPQGHWGVLKTTAVQRLRYEEGQNKALPAHLEARPDHEVMDGDILFTRAGPMNRVGILCVARPTRRQLMLSDKIIRFHLISGLDPDFAALALTAGYSSLFIEELKSGMAASQVNVSQAKLTSVPIPIPPRGEQQRIVAKVEQLMSLVDQLESQLCESHDTGAKLLEAVVARLAALGNPGDFRPAAGIQCEAIRAM